MFKTKLASFAVAAVVAGSAHASPLVFDPDGAGGGAAYTIDQLDWLPSSVLAKGGNQAIANFLNGSGGTEFTALSHFRLGQGLLGSDVQFSIGAATPYEITAVVGYTERVIAAAAGFAQFTYVDDGNAFIRIYYDAPKNASQLAGTGFGDGTLIFESGLSTINGFYTNAVTPPVLLDQADADNWNGQQTLSGLGVNDNFTIEVDPLTAWADPDFFKNLPLLSFLVTNVSLNNPFVATDPSYAFTQKDGSLYAVTTDAGVTSTLGAVNGGLGQVGGVWVAAGPDFIFSSDVNSSVRASAVPEPGSLALLGAALGLLGVVSRRRKAV